MRSKVKKNEIKCFLSNEADSFDCYVEIHAGAGGTESQDWANMLRRMYMKWSDGKNYKCNLISEHKGEEAGIKSSKSFFSLMVFWESDLSCQKLAPSIFFSRSSSFE